MSLFWREDRIGEKGDCVRMYDATVAAALKLTQVIAPARITHQPAGVGVVVIPTYNEAGNIQSILHAIRNLPERLDVLIVDDNSPDGTADLVRQMMLHDDGIYLLQRPKKDGLGNAYKAGFAFALRHGWKYIAQMDADFSHNPRDLPRLLNTCRTGADVAIGSRYVGGGRIKGWLWRRWLLSRCANLLAQLMLNSRVTDMTAGFKCFRREALAKINPAAVSSEGYIFQVEMNHRAGRLGLSLRQTPICFTDRVQGCSKLGKREAGEGMRQLITLAGWRTKQ